MTCNRQTYVTYIHHLYVTDEYTLTFLSTDEYSLLCFVPWGFSSVN
jgi:hypothetical protein